MAEALATLKGPLMKVEKGQGKIVLQTKGAGVDVQGTLAYCEV